MRLRCLLTLAAAVLSFGSAKAETPPLKIGALFCLTGACAPDGDASLKGAQIAVDEINLRGGILGRSVRLIVQDTDEAVSGAKAVSAYRQLRLDPDIHLFTGPNWTPAGLSLAPIAARDKTVVVITPSLGAAEFHKAGDNLFNLRGTDESATREMARYAAAKGWKRIAIFGSQQAWEFAQSDFFEDELRKLGGETAIRLDVQPTATMLSSEAAQIIASKPDAVFLSLFVQMALGTKALRDLNYTGPKLAAVVDEALIEEAQGALENTFTLTFPPASSEFSEKYAARYGQPPKLTAANSYDVIVAYARAAGTAGTLEPQKLVAALKNTSFEGAGGNLKFDAEGCATKEPRLLQVKNSKLADAR